MIQTTVGYVSFQILHYTYDEFNVVQIYYNIYLCLMKLKPKFTDKANSILLLYAAKYKIGSKL